MPVIGFLSMALAGPSAYLVAGFRGGLQEVGFVEGRNAAVEYRLAEGQYAATGALPISFAAEFGYRDYRRRTSAAAAKDATATIPIVFNTGSVPSARLLLVSLDPAETRPVLHFYHRARRQRSACCAISSPWPRSSHCR